ncbi:hypothetical protein BU23DRAFT_32636 [Bimuria novae-zelandiae CBS 107.79]|uniref:Uncharacterized protein n=1 Tax=Bimuria novae-zelandiae CBS 107.79 TaxID=1447943 RepID=A0A6A5VJ77_9PLEO|nr:hypothetical protein BU23DRAFT_32636 [Bimuria novae-zelandiae CBS 107.79]
MVSTIHSVAKIHRIAYISPSNTSTDTPPDVTEALIQVLNTLSATFSAFVFDFTPLTYPPASTSQLENYDAIWCTTPYARSSIPQHPPCFSPSNAATASPNFFDALCSAADMLRHLSERDAADALTVAVKKVGLASPRSGDLGAENRGEDVPGAAGAVCAEIEEAIRHT